MIIETQNMTKQFGRNEVVRGVSLSVPEGAALALIGANGAGKTTTLRMLVNLLSPDSGSAHVLGTDTRRLSHRDFLRIGYVSENQELPHRLTVAQYFDYLRTLYPNWDRALETDLRRQLDLPPDRRLGNLSHGMRMKTVLAAGLAFHPALLILDEPLSGLDPSIRDEVMTSLLKQAGETTIVISSHELSEIESCITHVAFMDQGRLLFQEAAENLGARFRQISINLVDESYVAGRLPSTWLSLTRSGHVLNFVETAFQSNEDMAQKLSSALGRFHGFEAHPMSLRDISKALIRAGRAEVRQ